MTGPKYLPMLGSRSALEDHDAGALIGKIVPSLITRFKGDGQANAMRDTIAFGCRLASPEAPTDAPVFRNLVDNIMRLMHDTPDEAVESLCVHYSTEPQPGWWGMPVTREQLELSVARWLGIAEGEPA